MRVLHLLAVSLALCLFSPVAPAVQSAGTGTNATAPVTGPTHPPILSWPANEVLKMVRGGMDEQVILAWVENFSHEFDLNADNILRLAQNGTSSAIITAMLRHDIAIQQARPAPLAAPAQAPAPAPAQGDAAPPATLSSPSSTEPPAAPNPSPSSQAPESKTGGFSIVQQSIETSGVPINLSPKAAPFYVALSPYGNWMNLASYGLCWQPNEAMTFQNWAPYDNGQWIVFNGERYWNSSYPWGWAAYHYGRWLFTYAGWVWFPDVTWSSAGSNPAGSAPY